MKGKKGTYWNCGEDDHNGRGCPTDKQDSSWRDGGTWKYQKGGKAGKGWDAEQLEHFPETTRAKEKTGTGMASHKSVRVRTGGMMGSRHW